MDNPGGPQRENFGLWEKGCKLSPLESRFVGESVPGVKQVLNGNGQSPVRIR